MQIVENVVNSKELAEQLSKNMICNKEILTRKDVCTMLSLAYNSSVFCSLVKDPTFPKSFTLQDGGNPRWRKQDIIKWVNRRYKQASQMIESIRQEV